MLSRLTQAFLLATLLVLLHSRHAQAVDPSFARSRPFGAGLAYTASLAVGDMDGDGDLDIVTGLWHEWWGNGGNLSLVHLNDGSGSFPTAHPYAWEIFDSLYVMLGDVDGDGDLDIVSADRGFLGNTYQAIDVVLNDGAANFTTGQSLAVGQGLAGLALGDIDGDGALDIVTGRQIYLNDGRGTFAAAQTLDDGGDTTYSVALGDLDGDGDLDIAAARKQRGAVYLNRGAGLFDPAQPFAGASDNAYSIFVGDVDGDGDLDVAGGSRLYFNNGAGNFATAGTLGGETISSGAIGDMDRDGDLDIVVVIGTGGDVQTALLLNDGKGGFGGPIRIVAEGFNRAAVADIDGDGHLDIIFGSQVQNAVYFNDGSATLQPARRFGPAEGSGDNALVGDMNGDGSLDIVLGNSIYLNAGNANFPALPALSRKIRMDVEVSVQALGDLDDDGDLDIVASNTGRQSVVYLNDGTGSFLMERALPPSGYDICCMALGDMDGDGDLDIVAGLGGAAATVYLNDGSAYFAVPVIHVVLNVPSSIALGDIDGDGDLDVIVGQTAFEGMLNVVYINDGAAGLTHASYFRATADSTSSVATGDFDGDGDLDVVTGDGRQGWSYRNDGSGRFATARSFGSIGDSPQTAVLADMDGDGDLDIVASTVATHDGDVVAYLNDGAGGFSPASSLRTFAGSAGLKSVAVGDMDGDGSLDVIAAGQGKQGTVYLNRYAGRLPAQAAVRRPAPTGDANFYSTPGYLADGVIDIPYLLGGAQGGPPGRLVFDYSLAGGGHWLPAVPAPSRPDAEMARAVAVSAAPDNAVLWLPVVAAAITVSAGNPHVFHWDTLASGFFGQSDNVVMRLRVYAQPAAPAGQGTYRYTNMAAEPFQRPYSAGQTFPFSVRGAQVLVEQDGQRRAAALVYRLLAGAERGGALMGGPAGVFRTDSQGYLQGRGQLTSGDRLLALVPISHTAAYDVYYTSAVDPSTGLPGFTVTEAGVQTLTVSSVNPLVLFNLDVALEWDASKDTTYLAQLQYDLNRTSELLYDWSDGQAALGRIRIFHDARRQPAVNGFQPWLNGHIRIYASNEVHPNAIQGGIVDDRTEETAPNGKKVVYTPGMVHIGSAWNRYADSSTLGEDWPRALAHELGHYLFFLDDNYIGQAPDGSVQFISSDPNTGCPGAMNDPYTDILAKYQPQPSWLPGCANTYSQQTLGRSDWETIVTHYPWLHAPGVPIQQINPGPSGQRLAFTEFEVVPPPAPEPAERQTLSLPIFTISTADGSGYRPSPDAHAFLLQDTRLIELGAPSLDQLVARGARQGDTLCLLEPDNQSAGCITTALGADQLVVQPLPDWQPQVIFSPVTSRTLTVQVAGLAGGIALKAQLYPRDGDATAAIDLPPAGSGYAGTFDLPEPVFEGSLRVWDANNPLRQVITDFVLGSNPTRWDSRDARWRARLARWRARLAPVISSGGKVAVLGDNVDFGSEDWVFSLQAATALPGLPTWATPIGQGYWLHASANAPSLANTAVSFNYDRRDVPAGQEHALHVFFWTGSAWTPLATNINTDQGIASAPTQGPGLYALAAALEIPLQGPGWNNFAYSIAGSPTPVGAALASITGSYSIVYSYTPAGPGQSWRAFDPTAPDWANNLKTLDYGQAYWIYATRPVTLYLSGGSTARTAAGTTSAATSALAPPAVFYGAVGEGPGFVPRAGMAVTALVNGGVCGTGVTQDLGGTIVYVLYVAAGAMLPGCGAEGSTVSFAIDGAAMAAAANWDNTRATNMPLTP